ncbi:MAG: 23S rRNA (pseudouridine(1915)-N(3))-methyltransferase RlmH [Firmicutes bacterium]|nr:23S rRNA (pseudouridine(1915)-N(3))-methyltransferase RlmH [Bacillota bacterium]
MIKILCVGKIKEKYLVELISDYQKRIAKYEKIEIIELKENINYEKELKNLKNHINKKDYNIVLDWRGKEFTSEELAFKISTIWHQFSTITFIIGPSNGVDDEIRRMANEVISFSKFTFPHGLFRGILLEQIYRCLKINNHETYHK